jgi:hypothetical protein
MKISMKNFSKNLVISLVVLFFYNCRKQNPQPAKQSVPANINASLRTHQPTSFLRFNDFEQLYQTIEDIKDYDSENRNIWEENNNFISMYTAFENIVKGDSAISNYFDSLSDDSIAYYSQLPIRHCNAVREYPESFIVVRDSSANYFDININNYLFSYISNSYGIVQVGSKIYQFTANYIKSIDNGDVSNINALIRATQSIPDKSITVVESQNGYIENGKIASTSTFVRSSIGNSGRHRTIIYQNWTQNNSSSMAGWKATTYKVRVRSLRRRVWGLWYDNFSRPLSLWGNVHGNQTYGQLANNAFLNVNWSFGVSNWTSSTHTWDYFLPNINGMNQNLNTLSTNGMHPQIYSSSITGAASGGASANTTYP